VMNCFDRQFFILIKTHATPCARRNTWNSAYAPNSPTTSTTECRSAPGGRGASLDNRAFLTDAYRFGFGGADAATEGIEPPGLNRYTTQWKCPID